MLQLSRRILCLCRTAFYSVAAEFTTVLGGLVAIAGLTAQLPPIYAQTPTPVTVPTWRYDLTHQGQNTSETLLTPANVNGNTFGKRFAVTVDSTIYAQPLYMPALIMSDGLLHNVFFVATENDSIYAFDADAGAAPLWKITLLDAAHGAGAGAKAIPWNQQDPIYGQGDIGPTIGITGTPVINPATNTMYVVGNTEEGGLFYSRLHAINILTGAEQTSPVVEQSPVKISATVAGTGQGSTGGQVSFDALLENQRPALDFYNGHVYIGFASHGDIGAWHGWLFSYDATTMEQTAALCLTPNGFGASLWGSGAGFPIDENATGGEMFLSTGNGTFDTNYPPILVSTELGQSVVRINLADGKLAAADAFTAFNAEHLNDGDYDLGSGGVLLIPDQAGAHPHILVQEGKEGRVLVLNRDHLGGYATGAASNTNALQDIPGASKGVWSTAAYWNGHVYVWGSGDVNDPGDTPKMFDLDSGVLSTTPSSVGAIKSLFPGATFSISSNGTNDGIAWAVRTDQFITYGPEVLYAWDANDLSKLLYRSDANASRDSAGVADKFAIPMVTNGKVYIYGQNHLTVYGLLSGNPTAAAPTITPDGGAIAATQTITLASSTSPAQIFYTLDGSTPTTSSTLYSGPFSISASATVNTITVAPGYNKSSSEEAVFNVEAMTPAPAFAPPGGTYTGTQQVALSDADSTAKIYFTMDGSTPTAASTLYSGPIQIAASETLNAIAVDANQINSPVVSAAYVINPLATQTPPVTFSPAAGTYTGTQQISIADTDTSAKIYYTADGSTPTTASTLYSGAIQVAASETLNAIAVDPKMLSSAVAKASYVIDPLAVQTPDVTFAPPAGTYASAQQVSIADSAAGAKIYYTTDGSAPSTASTLYSGPIEVSASETLSAIAAVDSQVNSAVAAAAYVITVAPSLTVTATAPPSVSPGGSTTSTVTIAPVGGFTGAVAVTCSVTASPASAIDLPTCTASQPASIAGQSSVTSTITLTTTAATSAESRRPFRRAFEAGAGSVLAALVFFLLPARGRRGRAWLSLLVLAVAVGMMGCGGTSSKLSQNSGTTPGAYTVTVYATSGTVKAQTNVSFVVQ